MFRSLLFIPGNNERFLVKSASLKPDILCFDLEDSVPSNDKEVARNLLEKHLASLQEDKESSVYVRINSVNSGLVDKDLGFVTQKFSNLKTATVFYGNFSYMYISLSLGIVIF